MPILPPEPDRFPSSLFAATDGSIRPPWWVARVRPRREKCLARLLGGDEIAFYLPLRRRRAGAANSSRVARLPLFPGYLFFQGEGRQRLRAFETGAILGLLQVENQEELHRELAALSLIQDADLPLRPWNDHQPGDPVRIAHGPLKGLEGIVVRCKAHCRLIVRVSTLQASVVAEVDAAWVEAAPPEKPKKLPVPKPPASQAIQPSPA